MKGRRGPKNGPILPHAQCPEIRTVNQLGVDETVFQSAGLGRRRSFVTAVSDIEARRVLDVFEGRQRVDLAEWLNEQGARWCEQVKVVVTDLHEPFRKAATDGLPNAVLVADPMHVVMAANRCPDKTRRRVQNEELLHRGRARERLSPRLAKRLDVMLAFGDPNGQVYEAWMTQRTRPGSLHAVGKT